MSNPSTDEPISLTELDARHDEILAQLDELDQRIQSVLKEHLPQKKAEQPALLAEDEPDSQASPPGDPERRAA